MSQRVNSKTYDVLLSSMLSHDAKEIDVWDAKGMDSVIYVDSREKAEYQVSHIDKALWLGYDDPDFDALDTLDKETTLIIYCSVGYRSEKMALQLEKKGFKNVYNLYGGIFEWVNQGNPVVNSDGDTTQKVHAYNKLWGVWLTKGEKVY